MIDIDRIERELNARPGRAEDDAFRLTRADAAALVRELRRGRAAQAMLAAEREMAGVISDIAEGMGG